MEEDSLRTKPKHKPPTKDSLGNKASEGVKPAEAPKKSQKSSSTVSSGAKKSGNKESVNKKSGKKKSGLRSMIFGPVGIFVIVAVVLVLCCCLCAGCFYVWALSIENNGSSVVTQKTYSVGDVIEINNQEITVMEFDDDVTEDSSYSSPKFGYKFVAVDVKIINNSTYSKYVSAYDFSIKDEEGYDYESTYKETKTPRLAGKTISKGKSLRGWITFEVPEDAQELTLNYEVNYSSTISVELE
jgi:hypothetical protein